MNMQDTDWVVQFDMFADIRDLRTFRSIGRSPFANAPVCLCVLGVLCDVSMYYVSYVNQIWLSMPQSITMLKKDGQKGRVISLTQQV